MSGKQNQDTPLDPRVAAELRRLSEDGIEPGRDLWPQLEQQLRVQDRRARKPVWTYAAAAAVLLVILGGLVWRLAWSPAAEGLDAIGPPRSLASLPNPISEEFQATFARYLSEREQILAGIADQLEDYPPEMSADIRRSLEEIEHALEEIEALIARRTSEPASENRLAELCELELRLLEVVEERLRGASIGGGVS